MRGGTISFTPEGYRRTDGVESETRMPCLRRITLTKAGEAAGAILRTPGEHRMTMSARPAFLLIGPQASAVATVQINQDAEIMLEAPLGGPSA